MCLKDKWSMVLYMLKTTERNPERRMILLSSFAMDEEDLWLSVLHYVRTRKRDVTVYVDRKCVGKQVWSNDL
jgi:hypothetical protein